MFITVEEVNDTTFKVTVTDGATTTHTVTVTKEYVQKLTGGKAPPKTLVEKSFEFLLQRGPIGAAIGGIAGAAAGIVRLFVKGAQEKAREKIKATYGVDISDKGVLRQIVDIAKQGFGGNLDMAIRCQQIRDLVELYAMATGQGTSGLSATVRPVSLLQQGGSLFQQSAGGLSLDRIGAGSPQNAGPIVVNITVPGAKEFFEKETVRVVVENPRAVQSALTGHAMSGVQKA